MKTSSKIYLRSKTTSGAFRKNGLTYLEYLVLYWKAIDLSFLDDIKTEWYIMWEMEDLMFWYFKYMYVLRGGGLN